MKRVIFDPNVLIAALISPRGAPAALYRALTRGTFELVTSPQLLAEMNRVLARAKFRRYTSVEEARAFVTVIERLAVRVDDPPPTAGLTADPADTTSSRSLADNASTPSSRGIGTCLSSPIRARQS